MLTLAREGITSFSMLPLKIIFVLGCALFAIGFFLFAGMLLYKIFIDYSYFSGTAVLAAFIILNNGFLITIFGILSMYQISMHKEIQNRPNYIISDRID